MDAFVQIVVIGILLGGIYGLVSMGLTLIFGVTRVVNFAQGELVMLGMYATYLANGWLGWSPYLTFVVVVPVLFVLGLVIQRLVIQPLSEFPSMQLLATFGLVLLLQSLALIFTRGTVYTLRDGFASQAFDLGPVRVDAGRVTILVVTTAVAIGLRLLLRDTSFGRSVRAVTQDRRAARLMGINVERTFLVTFGIGSALAGLAGVLLTPVYSITPNVGQNFIFAAFAVVVVGGLGSVTGAYVGGFLIGLVDALTGYYLDPTLSSAFYFAVFLWVLVVKPAGLFGQPGTEKLGETV